MEYKTFRLDTQKFDEETGTFVGYASVFGNEDLQGDVVEKGSFSRTIDHSKGKVPILWQHKQEEPIGVGIEMKEDNHGLWVRGQLNLETQRGREAYALLKQGALRGMSIGYDVIKHQFDRKSGRRFLKELRLWEYSIVTFGANPVAGVTSVKDIALMETKTITQDNIPNLTSQLRKLHIDDLMEFHQELHYLAEESKSYPGLERVDIEWLHTATEESLRMRFEDEPHDEDMSSPLEWGTESGVKAFDMNEDDYTTEHLPLELISIINESGRQTKDENENILETKAGRMISARNMDVLRTAVAKLAEVNDTLQALLSMDDQMADSAKDHSVIEESDEGLSPQEVEVASEVEETKDEVAATEIKSIENENDHSDQDVDEKLQSIFNSISDFLEKKSSSEG